MSLLRIFTILLPLATIHGLGISQVNMDGIMLGSTLTIRGMECRLSTLRHEGGSIYLEDAGIRATATPSVHTYGQVFLDVDSCTSLILHDGSTCDILRPLHLAEGLTESSSSSLTSSTGGYLYRTFPISGDIPCESLIGLDLKPSQNTTSQPITISLYPEPVSHRLWGESIARYWTFRPSIRCDQISLHLPSPCPIDGAIPYQSPSGDNWKPFPQHETGEDGQAFFASGCSQPIASVTLFGLPETTFPKVITANGDGINDRFEIIGIDRYPEGRLIILDRKGKTVYDRQPYDNSFGGENLSPGTYYYIFTSAGQTMKKSTFTLYR